MPGSLDFTVNIDTDAAVSIFRRLREVVDTRNILTSVGFRHLEWTQENFDSGGRLVGGWTRLSPNTIAARRGGGGGARPLQDTGALRRSVDIKGVDINGNRLEVGFTDQKAEIHHYGVPDRPIRPVNGRVLTFMTANGRVFVTHALRWPGIPARKLIPAQQMAERLAEESITNLFNEFNTI